MSHYRTHVTKGFTVVELLVIIVVIGLLAGLSIISYGSWRTRIAATSVKTDLNSVATAMKSELNFKNAYPSGLPSSFTSSEDVTVTWAYGGANSFCINGVSESDGNVKFYIQATGSVINGPLEGACSGGAPASPSPSAVALSSSAIEVTWSPVSGATGYEVKYGIGSPTTTASCTSPPCTLSGLSANTTYNISVVATSSAGNSAPGTTSAMTSITAPSPAPTLAVTGPTNAKVGTQNVNRYVATAGGSTCASGNTLQWKIVHSPSSTPPWSSASWQTSNTKTIDVVTNGTYDPSSIYIFAKPRCVNGSQTAEYPSHAQFYVPGSGNPDM